MRWDRKRLLGYVETIQLIVAVTDKNSYLPLLSLKELSFFIVSDLELVD